MHLKPCPVHVPVPDVLLPALPQLLSPFPLHNTSSNPYVALIWGGCTPACMLTLLTCAPHRRELLASGLPLSVDWRAGGRGPLIRYQGDCGSCWASAAVILLESLLLRNFPKLTPASAQVSMQQLVSG